METGERPRHARRFSWFEDFVRDVPYALRGLRRTPGFTLAAVVTLAIGIGAATAVYSVVGAILLEPLPYPESGRLVRLMERLPPPEAGRSAAPPRNITYAEFVEWRSRTVTLSAMVATLWRPQVMVSTPQGAARLSGGLVSPEWFALLGTRAMLGRTLLPVDVAESRDVVVLSAGTWRRHFGSDPQVIGRSITLQSRMRSALVGQPMEVVGVMPDGFEDPAGRFEFWTPMVMSAVPAPGGISPAVQVIGQLAPGITKAAAEAEATAIGTALRGQSADGIVEPRNISVTALKERLVAPVRPALRVLLAAVSVLLLIVCANMASLMLARGTSRHREIAMRLAIGASRGRIIRQLLAESLVLSLAGGLLGAALGAFGVFTIRSLATVQASGVFRLVFGSSLLPRVSELVVDADVLVLAVGLAIVTSVLCGIVPALRLSRADHLDVMNTRAAAASATDSRLRSALVVMQLVMATMLLVGAGLLARSFVTLSHVDTGYDPANVFAFQLVLPEDYATVRKTNVIEAILAGLRATPGVEAAGFAYAGPLIGVVDTVGYFVPPGRSASEMRESPDKPHVRSVSHDYVSAMGIQIVDGRGFTAQDDATAPWVMLVNRTLARQLFGESSPVGAMLAWHGANDAAPVMVEVIGVVDDVRPGRIDQEPAAQALFDYRQMLGVQQHWHTPTAHQERLALGFMSFVARTAGDPAALGPTVRSVVLAADPNAGIDAMAPLDSLISTSIARPRFYAVLLGLFAAVAGVLAAVGIYGVLAYAVVQRTHEIGVRMALGAERRAVLAFVLRRGLVLTAIGIGLGLAGAAGLSRYLASLLFGLSPLDLTTYVLVACAFAAVATLAAYLPARRAAQVDPVVALRYE